MYLRDVDRYANLGMFLYKIYEYRCIVLELLADVRQLYIF